MAVNVEANTDAAFAPLLHEFQVCAHVRTQPWFDFELPSEWLVPEREFAYWRAAAASGVFELQMAMASHMLEKLLVQNKYLRGRRFANWPSRDRHQLWATLWLALRFWPDRLYMADEVASEMSRLLITPDPAIAFALQADLLRRDLVVREETTGSYVASRRHILFLLDGDKLFQLRAAAVSDRPWWLLPLNTQFLMAPQADVAVIPTGRAFRVVLLAPSSEGDPPPLDALSAVSCKLVPSDGKPIEATPLATPVVEGEHAFAALECAFDAPTTCIEVRVSVANAAARLPPFRVDVRIDGGTGDGVWRLLQCQPLPTADELCNSGRDGARCFLPRAVAVAAGACIDRLAAEKTLADLLEGGVVKRWPSKQKQQAAVVGWLARHMIPGVRYAEGEIDWLIATRFTRAQVPDCPTIRKEFERRGLVEREPGGGGFIARANGGDAVEPTVVAVS